MDVNKSNGKEITSFYKQKFNLHFRNLDFKEPDQTKTHESIGEPCNLEGD